MTIFPITENYHRGAVPRLGVRRDDKDRLLDAMRGQKPIAMAAGYLTDYATGETTNITDAMYEKNGVRWTEEMTYNLEHNDMEISDEFADALLGRENDRRQGPSAPFGRTTDVFAPSFNSALPVRWNLAGGTSRRPSRAPRAFGLTEATPADRSSHERMAHKMRAMERESLMRLPAS